MYALFSTFVSGNHGLLLVFTYITLGRPRLCKKVKVPILVYIVRKGPELILDSTQSACR